MDNDNMKETKPFLDDNNDCSRDASLELEFLRGRDSTAELRQLGFDDVSATQPSPPRRSAPYAIVFMLGAQVFSAMMNVSIRLLENTPTHLHPLQILAVRMSVTTACITAWLWKQNVPYNILGRPENRTLLIVRAFGGFLGVFGLYYSLRYLNLSEATVITFMMPLVASFGGFMLLKAPFSWIEILLSIVSLVGVLLVASPDTIFPSAENDTTLGDANAADLIKRIWALGVGLLGVCGSAAAFLCMSAIGKTESPMTVVNYFGASCTLVSLVSLLVLPGLSFSAPGDVWEWVLFVLSGISGFLMQLLITMSLRAEKSLVAVNMVYTQIVFALTLDAIVFHSIPQPVSLLGCALICAAALFLAWTKTRRQKMLVSTKS